MITSNSLTTRKNSYDLIFLIGLMAIMLITVASFLIINFLMTTELNTTLNKFLPPSEDTVIIEEQV